MPVSMTIRNIPAATRDELAARAARTGRSLQEYLRAELIALADRPGPAEWVARVRERKHQTGSCISAAAILGHRDAERR